MKQLNMTEAEALAALLKRAIASGQLNLHVASPYAKGEDWKKDGWDWNDRHDGNAISSTEWHVEVYNMNGEDPETDKEYQRPELSIYVDNDELRSLTELF